MDSVKKKRAFSSNVQGCIWIGGVCTIVNPYWNQALWVPKAMSRLWSLSSPSPTAPVKIHLRSPSPSAPSKTSQMPLNTRCRLVYAEPESLRVWDWPGRIKSDAWSQRGPQSSIENSHTETFVLIFTLKAPPGVPTTQCTHVIDELITSALYASENFIALPVSSYAWYLHIGFCFFNSTVCG